MKKFALALMAVSAAIFGTGLVANAYPPGAGVVTTSSATGVAGYTVTVNTTCQPGETVTVTLVDETATATCGAAGTASLLSLSNAGSASVNVIAPAVAGSYTGTILGSVTGDLGSFTVTVTAPVTPGGGLPATGSNSTSTMTILAIGLFAVGAGLFGVSQVRRRTVVA